MPAKPSQRRTAALLLSSLAVLTAYTACTHALPDEDLPRHRRNDRAPHSPAVGDAAEVRVEGRGDHFELISTSSQNKAPPEDKVASSDLPAADKQYDYPLVRPVYAPFVTRPSSYAVPYVEILDHHRDPPFSKPSHFVTGSPMVSTVVVQDMSQTPLRPHEEVTSLVDNFQHLGPTKIPFTDVQVVTRPIGGADKKPNFTDKLEETSLEHGGGGDSDEDLEEDDDDDDNEELLENPPNLDLGGIVEDVVRKVFQENPVLHDAAELAPRPEVGVKTWPCPPVTCCTRPATKAKDAKDAKQAKRRCSTFVNCVAGRSPGCPLRAERVPQALALTTPSNGYSNTTGPKADVRVGEPQPRFKKKKILKKKKKLLKKFLLPLLLAYKLLFLMVVPMMVNGMMMMMSSSGMAGFFFALIGASITMGGYSRSSQHSHPVTETKTRTEVVTVAGSDWSGQESRLESTSVVPAED
ncbi:uncharacterized protein LOC117653098 [Thrips palmi]|uniref:Uncharacterized protein LOC117653098 n=1 Tax=Thrips palmi TaxID=161013 RepID=A0A6P9AFI4_THRPL|nr:uncharacterized protein LOC117653098 [Thrips palmi]